MRSFARAITILSVLGAGALVCAGDQSEGGAPAQTTFTRYCLTCHNEKLRAGGMALSPADWNNIPGEAKVWEKVIRKLRTKTMPPAGLPRPDAAGYDALASYLENEIDRAAADHSNSVPAELLHRLNRTEYQNAIRDLLALQVDGSALLPADDQSYGFDNIAGVLKMSPTLLERYLGAARQISRLAIGTTRQAPDEHTVRLRSDLSQYDQMEGLPPGTRGGAAVEYNFPQDGEYVIRAELLDLFAGAQVKEPHQLEVAIDGEQVKVFTLAPRRPPAARPAPEKATAPETAVDKPKPSPEEQQALGFGGKPAQFEVRVPVKAGPRLVTVTFFKKTSALAESVREPFSRPHGEGDYLLYEPHLGTISIVGPFNPQGAHDTPSRQRIFACHPAQPAEETPCARRILSTIARRAWRRPASDTEIARLLAFYNEGRSEAGFEAGIERSLRAILVSPDFLYRVELPVRAGGAVSPLSDYELASRLSFFLWSSIPDDDLLGAASQGRLRDSAVLERQVRRMLKDDRSAALAADFAGQWLRLRNVLGQQPDDVIFPNFNDNLRHDFVKETELFFGSMVKENRGVIDLLTADYSFLNERLAVFYGIPNVHGNDFRRVTLADPARRGLLGQASILMVTSYSDRTSPVGRGKWILENVLGTPPPPPPPNVPALKEKGINGQLLSMRERMVQHRADPACSGCHTRMDPLGFAMENFDAVGRWRTIAENGGSLDVSGALPDGTKFNGPAELRALLVKNPEQFVTVVAEKLLVYALGRGLDYRDAPAVRKMVRGAASDNYSFESLVLGLVKSTPFMGRGNQPLVAARERGIQ
jgi:hypothetical protein